MKKTPSLKASYRNLRVPRLKYWQYVQLMVHGNTVLTRIQYENRDFFLQELDNAGLYVLIYESEHGTPLMITKERNQKTMEVRTID